MPNTEGVISPGGFVRGAMEAKGWTQTDLAYALGTMNLASWLASRIGCLCHAAKTVTDRAGRKPCLALAETF